MIFVFYDNEAYLALISALILDGKQVIAKAIGYVRVILLLLLN